MQGHIKKMSGMFFVVAMTEKTSYRGRIPVFVFFSGCVHPGQDFSTWCLLLANSKHPAGAYHSSQSLDGHPVHRKLTCGD
jgi:hypothetical protein